MTITVEIHGVGTHNRGAELMAIAVADRVKGRWPGARIVVSSRYGGFEDRARHHFFTTTELSGRPLSRLVGRSLPAAIRRQAGMLRPEDIDAVLDASGFAFGDPWGPGAARGLLAKMGRPSRRSQPLVLLPQAFGPFANQDVARATSGLLQRAALVFARDRVSRRYLEELSPGTNVRTSPDFTLGVAPRPLADAANLPSEFVAVVPNTRVLDMSPDSTAYVSLLACAIRSLRALGLQPVIVLHDAWEDAAIVNLLQGAGDVPTFSHHDPRVIKWTLGRARFVIGSRYHALAGALSQAVPCVGIGWAHKYRGLFEDFGCGEFLLPSSAMGEELDALIGRLCVSHTIDALKAHLKSAATQLESRTDTMWNEVFAALDRSCG